MKKKEPIQSKKYRKPEAIWTAKLGPCLAACYDFAKENRCRLFDQKNGPDSGFEGPALVIPFKVRRVV
jgi:hypothetical protein